MFKKLFFSALVFTGFSAVLVVFSPEDTKAYGSVPSTSSISVVSLDGSQNFDVSESGSNSWYNRVIVDEDFLGTCSYLEDILEAKNSGRISVSQIDGTSSWANESVRKYQKGILIMFDAYGSNYQTVYGGVDLGEDPDVSSLTTTTNSSGGWAFMYIKDDGTYRFDCNKNGSSSGSCGVNSCPSTPPGAGVYSYTAGWLFGQEFGQIYYSTYPITYPVDWDAGSVPAEPGATAQLVRPDFSWVTLDLNMKITHIKKADLLPNGEDYQLGITVGFCPDGYADVGALCENYEAVRYYVIDKGGTFSFDGYEYGDYIIDMEYVRETCIRYPSYPATPDYCYYEYPEDTDEYDFESTEIRLNLGKQYSSSGSTIGQECDISGYCEAPSPYEDCSTFGIDIGGYFQCVIANFGTWLMLTLQTLFIPNFGNFKVALDDFTGSVQSQFGFLYRAFEMFVEWINSLLVITPDCTVDLGSATFFGAPIAYNFCAFEESAPTIFNPMFTTARLVIAGSFIFIAYRRLIEIIKGMGR